MVATIKPLIGQIMALDGQIASAVSQHPDGEICLSLFKGSFITAAEPLAEIGDSRARYRPLTHSPGDAGQAALMIESGKRKAACTSPPTMRRFPLDSTAMEVANHAKLARMRPMIRPR